MKNNIIIILMCCLLFGGGGLQAFSQNDGDFNPPNPDEPAAIDYCRLMVSADPAEAAYVSGGGKYIVNGNSVYISTSANNNENYTYTFLYWTLNGEKTSYSQYFWFTPQKGNFELVAHYEKKEVIFDPNNPDEPSATNVKRKYYLTLTSSIKDACSFNIASGIKHEEQSSINVYAYLNSGYQFDGWKLNGTLVSTSQNYFFNMPSVNSTLEACVSEIPFDPDSPADPSGSGTNVDLSGRQIIDLIIGNANNAVDKTRVVFNEQKTLGYDTGSDASKFVSTDANYQIYTLDSDGAKYSVNQRPVSNGEVPIGIIVKQAGSVTISATRLDCSVFIYDKLLDVTQSLATNGYSFTSTAGTIEDRFVIKTFSADKYRLFYLVDGKEYQMKEYESGAEVKPIEEPTKEGYTFSGWSEIPSTMPAKDVTVTGNFIANKYKIIYTVDGKEYQTAEVEYGAKLNPIDEPTKEGYTFSGWSEIPNTMPAKDVTVTGTFNINKYKIIYVVDGKEYQTAEVEYGTELNPIDEPTKEGYTFSGWSEIPSKMPAKDVTVTGSFTKGAYKLVYIVDGVVYKTINYDYGITITPEPEPEREGYTFSGWSEIPGTMPAKEVTITGTFTINKYKLIYKVDDAEYKTFDFEYGAELNPIDEPTKEGYTFSGWSEIPNTMPAKDVTVTGTFNINKYKIIYVVDGKEYQTAEVEYGTELNPIDEPTKEGYTFSGWSEIPSKMPAKDVTVTGSFTKGAYKLVYIVDGVVYKTINYDYGITITPEPEPEREGYTFSGWSEIPGTMPAKEVTITGTFTINKYKLIYKVDDAEYKTFDFEYGAELNPIDEPTKEGYTFSGWSEIPGTMPAKDVTVTGTFNINKYKIIYVVDGKEYQTAEVEYGTELNPIDEPTKEGYTFSGWSEIPETMPAKDVTVTGSFSINKYKLIYKVDDVEYKTIEVDYGATITAEAEPTKEGYTFSGWSEIPATMPAKDVTITGFFTKDVQILVGDVNNDGTVDISDYIGVANHILGNTPEGFNEKAADVNSDGSIDISDYIGVANIILTGKP